MTQNVNGFVTEREVIIYRYNTIVHDLPRFLVNYTHAQTVDNRPLFRGGVWPKDEANLCCGLQDMLCMEREVIIYRYNTIVHDLPRFLVNYTHAIISAQTCKKNQHFPHYLSDNRLSSMILHPSHILQANWLYALEL